LFDGIHHTAKPGDSVHPANECDDDDGKYQEGKHENRKPARRSKHLILDGYQRNNTEDKGTDKRR